MIILPVDLSQMSPSQSCDKLVVNNRQNHSDESNTLILPYSQEDVMRRKRDFTNGNNRKERLRKVREAFPAMKTFL